MKNLLKYSGIIVLLLMLSAFVACQQKISEEEIITEIRNWWDVEEIDEVVIDDIKHDKDKAKVIARLIVAGDTTYSTTYEFERFDKGWRLVGDPVDPWVRMVLAEAIPEKRKAKLKENMLTLQLATEDFCTIADGVYPADIHVKAKELANEDLGENGERSINSLLPPYVVNPYDSEEPAVIMGSGSPEEWRFEYMGKVVYFPVQVKGKSAKGYRIKGSSEYGFIDAEYYCLGD